MATAGGGGGTPVELGKPEKLNWPKSVTAVGSLRSDESVIVRAEQSGRITALNFKEGQPVKAGQILVQLDDSLARAELEQAKANQKLAKAKFDRAVELQQKNFISGQARDEAENAMRVADATVALAEAKRCQVNACETAQLKRQLDDEFGTRRWAFQQPGGPQTVQEYLAHSRLCALRGRPA